MKKLIILPISIILLLLIIYIGLSLYITDLAYTAERKTPEETPPDYSLTYEDISFKSYGEDSIELKGWWIPGNKKDVAIVWVHGLDSERSGGEGKLEMMKEINEIGYSLLTFDLRGHGESGTAPLGLGVREKEDVYGAIEFLSNEKNIKKVGLWGISYGAVTVIDAGINVPDLDAEIVGIMADTPYFSVLELLTKEVADRTPIPKFVADILKFGIIQSGKILQGMDINDVPDSMANNNKINFPILITSCKTDERVPESHPSRVYSFSRESSEYHVFDKCEDHGEAYETNKGKYMDLFKKYFSSRF
ncbi:MAG: alpha/beta fold hydrolase [Chloroflexota bacterium]|nr:alpha/beta fold hydrolase [Chloroflexota bacterium]|tara:strand:- start:3442 stop:4356 length:915 start_codon:yes stop_codon:yes gene_type:complete